MKGKNWKKKALVKAIVNVYVYGMSLGCCIDVNASQDFLRFMELKTGQAVDVTDPSLITKLIFTSTYSNEQVNLAYLNDVVLDKNYKFYNCNAPVSEWVFQNIKDIEIKAEKRSLFYNQSGGSNRGSAGNFKFNNADNINISFTGSESVDGKKNYVFSSLSGMTHALSTWTNSGGGVITFNRNAIQTMSYGAKSAYGSIENVNGTLNILDNAIETGAGVNNVSYSSTSGYAYIKNGIDGVMNIDKGINYFSYGNGINYVSELKNEGNLNIIGDQNTFGIRVLSFMSKTSLTGDGTAEPKRPRSDIINSGTINLNKYAIGNFYGIIPCVGSNCQQGGVNRETKESGAPVFGFSSDWLAKSFRSTLDRLQELGSRGAWFTNKSTGIVNVEAGLLFDGDYTTLSTGKTGPIPITMINANGEVASVTSESFGEFAPTQTGNVTLDYEWKYFSIWEDGGTINFTDVAAGTALAESIKSQFEAAFGTGTSINFTGTGSGSGSSKFDMNVVNALISEGKLASGSVVTSEALTHSGKTFTLGNTGDMTQDTGFMGIQGSTGITVKDGKTLTLMGSQATMAMAVGADTRDANYVITDAPMTLTNGMLNLGHKTLSATEGTLAAVTFDRESSVNVNNGIYSIDSLKGEGSLSLSTGTRTTVVGDLSATQVTNAGTLTVNGQTVLGASPEAQSTYAASKRQTLSNEKGATANFNGGLVVNDFVQVKNREGGTLNAGHVKVDTFGRIMNYTGATMTYASIDAYGIVGNQGTLNVSGAYVVGDEGETTFGGETQVGTLSVGRTAKTLLVSRDGQEAIVHNTGKTYADELDLVSGHIQVEKDGVLAGKTLKNGAVGSDITVDVGGTFGFSHDKSSLDNALKNYTGSKDDKAILALNTDLHFANGGTLTVGSVDDAKGTVNLGNDALLLLGTTQLHGEALLNGESSQHLHVEDGAVIAMTDDLLWGNHYLMKGFDDASTAEILKIGILDKDGKKLTTRENDKGIFVTVGSDKILDKDKSYRFVNQMNWLLDGHQDLTAEHGDVAFLTAALVDKQGALATNRMEALAMDAGVLAETQRMGAQVQTTMLDHASSARKGYGTFWADGIFSKTDSGAFKRSTGTSSYEADTTGFAFGMDLPLGDDSWRLGAAFSAQRGDLDGDFGLTSDIEGYGFSVYGGKTFTSGLNLTGAMTYMMASHEVDAFNLGKVKADVDANMWVLGARVSMPFAYHQVLMTPYIGADVMKVKQDGFTSSWSDKSAFHYADVDATLFRTPVGVKAGTFMPLELLGRSGTLNWDADVAFVPQFGDKDVDYRVSGVSNGHADGMRGSFVNDWLTTANFGMSWQGAAGAFGLYYGIEKGDVRDWSSSVKAKASLFF